MTKEEEDVLKALLPRLNGPYSVEVQGTDGVKSYVILDIDGHEFARIDPAPVEVSGPCTAYQGTALMLASSWDLYVASRRAVEAMASQPPNGEKLERSFRSLMAALGKANGHDTEMLLQGRGGGEPGLDDANLELPDADGP